MEKKFKELTICDAFLLSKVMENPKVAKRLMEKLTGEKITKITYPPKNIVSKRDGRKGIYLELHLNNEKKDIYFMQLFLCEEDVFGKGHPVYHIVERCREIPEIILDWGLRQIFVCGIEDVDEKTEEEDIRALIHYIKNPADKRSNFAKMLDDEVRRVKSNLMYKREYEEMLRVETEKFQRAFAKEHQKRKKNDIPIM